MRIVGSLTTIPPRLKYIGPIVKSILDQTRELDLLYINIPYKCRRGNKTYNLDELDESVKNHKLVYINRCDEDYGPLTKLLPTLYKETDPDTLILTFDDDVLITRNTIEKMINKAIEYPNSALSFTGMVLGKFPFYLTILSRKVKDNKDRKVDWILGTSVCAYRRKMLNIDNLLSYKNVKDNHYKDMIMNNDDLWISADVERNGYDKRVIGSDGKNYTRTTEIISNNPLTRNFRSHFRMLKYGLRLRKDMKVFNSSNREVWTKNGVFWFIIFLIFLMLLLYIINTIMKLNMFINIGIFLIALVVFLILMVDYLFPND